METAPSPGFSFVDERLKSVRAEYYQKTAGSFNSHSSPETEELYWEIRNALIAKGHSMNAVGRFTTRITRFNSVQDGYFTVEDGSFITEATQAIARSLYEVQLERQQTLIASGEIDDALSVLFEPRPDTSTQLD